MNNLIPFLKTHKFTKSTLNGGRYENLAPRNSETFCLSDYEVTENKPSAFLPGKKIKDLEASYTKCPGCESRLPVFDHSSYCQCKDCGLKMQSFGNGLSVWR